MFGGERKGKKERKKEKKRKERKGKKGQKGKMGNHFCLFLGLVYGKREEEGKRSEKLYLLSKITEIGPSVLVGSRVKAYLLGEGYAWAPKSRSFDAVPDFRFLGSRKFRV